MRLAPLFCLCGCSADVLLQFPFQSGDQSLVLVVEQRDTLDLYAVDSAARAQTPILAEYTEFEAAPLQLTALFFTVPLTELGLTAGRLIPQTEGGPVPRPDRIEARLVRDTEPEPWQRIDDLPGRLAELKLPRATPCRRPTVEYRADFPSEFDSLLALTTIDGAPAALQGAHGPSGRPNQFLRVSQELTVAAPVNLEAELLAAHSGHDGQLWVVGLDQARQLSVWRGSNNLLTRPFLGTPVAFNDWTYHLTLADPAEGSDVVYLLARSGKVWRADVNGWAEFARVPLRPDQVNDRLGDLIPLGPRELLVIAPDGRGAYRVTDGQANRQRTPVDSELDIDEDRLLVLHQGPAGLMMGSNAGFWLRWEGSWLTLSEPILVNGSVESFIDVEQGVVAGGYYGMVRQWYTNHGECAAERAVVGQRTSVRRMMWWEGSVYFAGRDPLARTEFLGKLRFE